jgi:hypothetical protein
MAAYMYGVSEDATPQTIHSKKTVFLKNNELTVAQITKLVGADETFSIFEDNSMEIYSRRLETPEEVGIRVEKAKWYNARRQEFLLKNKRL